MGADDQQNSEQPDRTKSIDNKWQKIKTAYTETALKVLGRRKKKCKSWIRAERWRKIAERRKLKKKMEMHDRRGGRTKHELTTEKRTRRRRGVSGNTKETG